jgi:hypothetical protein
VARRINQKNSWWKVAVAGVLLFAVAVLGTPKALESAHKARQLKEQGLDSAGTVIAHKANESACKSSVTVEYLATASKHQVSLMGCGATVKELPLGTKVMVRYLSTDSGASITHAHAQTTDAASDSYSPIGLILMWIATPLLWGLAWFLRTKQKNKLISQEPTVI